MPKTICDIGKGDVLPTDQKQYPLAAGNFLGLILASFTSPNTARASTVLSTHEQEETDLFLLF